MNQALLYCGLFFILLNLFDLLISLPYVNSLEGNPFLFGNPWRMIIGKLIVLPLLVLGFVFLADRQGKAGLGFVFLIVLCFIYFFLVVSNLWVLKSKGL